MAFYRKLEDDLNGHTDARSLATLASAYFDLGRLTAEIGDQAGALASHERARVIREKLCAANPAHADYHHAFAMSHNNIGNLPATDKQGSAGGVRAAADPGEAVRGKPRRPRVPGGPRREPP
ncbi:MAG: hypothetical protein U0835_20415 [Isosphaeraceae bacterium]